MKRGVPEPGPTQRPRLRTPWTTARRLWVFAHGHELPLGGAVTHLGRTWAASGSHATPAPAEVLDLGLRRTKSEDMTSRSVDSPRRLLTLGRVDRIQVQVGFRARPDDRPYQQFLLDLPVSEADSARGGDAFDEQRVLAALEPVLYAGAEAPRHYSLHQHRWHTSWGASPGVLEIGLLVTTGARTTATISEASHDSVTGAFRDLMEVAGRPQPTPTARDAAILQARRAAAMAYAMDLDALSVNVEEHRPAENSWTVGLRATAVDQYEVVVGVVDGYAGSVRVRHEQQIEVSDSVGSE